MRFKKVYIEITNVCNLNCSFCKKDEIVPKFLSLEEIEHIFKEIKPYSNFIYLHVKGEPLMHPKFQEILKLAGKYGLKVNITTNGTLLPKRKEELIINPPRQMNISCHALSLEEIKNILPSVKELSKYTKISLRLWQGKEEEKLNIINSFIKEDKNIFINMAPSFEWPNIRNNIISSKGSCYGLQDQLAILSNGIVTTCCLDSEGINNLGNIFNESLESILKKEQTINILKGFQNKELIMPLCQRCSFCQKLKISQ